MIAQSVPRRFLEWLETDTLKTRVVIQTRFAAILVRVTVFATNRSSRRRHVGYGFFHAIF